MTNRMERLISVKTMLRKGNLVFNLQKTCYNEYRMESELWA